MASAPQPVDDADTSPRRLAENIMLFVRLLRASGLKVGPSAMLDAVRSVQQVGIEKRPYLYHSLAASLLSVPKTGPCLISFHLFWESKIPEQMRNVLAANEIDGWRGG